MYCHSQLLLHAFRPLFQEQIFNSFASQQEEERGNVRGFGVVNTNEDTKEEEKPAVV